MTRFLRAMSLALFVGATFLPAVATAEPTLAQQKEGLQRYKEGFLLHQKDREEEALLKFSEAYALTGSVDALFAMARTEQLTNRLVVAIVHFKQVASSASAKPAEAEESNLHVAEISKKLMTINVDAPPGTTLALDGAKLDPAQREVYALPGTHTIDASLDVRSVRRELNGGAGSAVTLKLFQEAAALVAPAPAANSAPPAPPEAPSALSEVAPRSPSSSDPSEAPGASLTTGRKIAIGMGAGAVVVAGVGIAFGVVAKNNENSANTIRASLSGDSACYRSASSACASLSSAASASRTEALTATILDISGGALAAAALVTWLVSGRSAKQPPRNGVFVEPFAAPRTAGIGLRGAF